MRNAPFFTSLYTVRCWDRARHPELSGSPCRSGVLEKVGATLVVTVDRPRMVRKIFVAVIALLALEVTTGCGDIIDFDGGNTLPKK
jgi:hypothetical protein